MIRFSQPYISGDETNYIKDVLVHGNSSSNGKYTKLCNDAFRVRYGFNNCFLTTSCTDALEMCALLCDIQPGDEVVMPSYTFVSSANPFILRGAKVVFCDSMQDHPNLSIESLEQKISNKTKAIVWVHYAGALMNVKEIKALCKKKNILLIEDAAHAIDSKCEDGFAGGFGDLACMSFHSTKNISSGEGGMLIINNDQFLERAEIIWEKGTNKAAYLRGEVGKYEWVDVGSSYLASEFTAAIVYSQLKNIDLIQSRRKEVWDAYDLYLRDVVSEKIRVKGYNQATHHNSHIYYVMCNNTTQRFDLINSLKSKGIHAAFHYQSLHMSPFYLKSNPSVSLKNAEMFNDCLLRLPLHSNMTADDAKYVVESLVQP